MPVKNLKVGLKELEPYVRNGNLLETGRGFNNFGGLRPREVLALWLLCVVIENEYQSDRFKICTDPEGADGIIYDSEHHIHFQTEHILISQRNNESEDMESAILKHIEKKQNKGGAAYASGKTLVVLINKQGGNYSPNKVARKLPKPIDFESIWIVGLHEIINSEYYYNVIKLEAESCPIWRIHINKTFDKWKVTRIQ